MMVDHDGASDLNPIEVVHLNGANFSAILALVVARELPKQVTNAVSITKHSHGLESVFFAGISQL